MAVRSSLSDVNLEAALNEFGYVRVPLLSPETVSALYTWYEERAGADGPNPPGAYDPTYAEFSTIHSYPDFRRAAYRMITETVIDVVDEILVGYRPLVANFVNKPPGTGIVPLHQNWAVVDEREFRSLSVWIALVDCTVANGTLHVLDGSHLPFRGARGMWSYRTFGGVQAEVVQDYLRPIEVRAGEAVILDDALVHYSPPNRSNQRRLAIQLIMVPEEAEAVFHEELSEEDGVVDVQTWRVLEDFFWGFGNGSGDERYAERLNRTSVEFNAVTLSQIEEAFGRRREPA